MARMTEEEAWALDEYYTPHTPKLSGDGKSGFFAKHSAKGDTILLVEGRALELQTTADSPHHTTLTEAPL